MIDWGQVRDRLANGSLEWFLAAVAVAALSLVVGALRWQLFLLGTGIELPLRTTLRVYFVGAFSNNVLPTAFGGDAARAMLVGGGRRMTQAFTSVTVDRLTSIGCLVLLAGIAAAADSGIPTELRAATGVLWAGGLTLAGGVVLTLRSERVRGWVPARLVPISRTVAETLRRYAGSRVLVLWAFVIGLVHQSLVVVSAVWLAKAIDLELSAGLLAVVLPLVLVLTLFPISVAGFGVREGGFVACLGLAGVDAGAATVLSLLTVAAMALASLPGAVGLATRRLRPGNTR